jgi:hypothetical protein
MLKACLGDYAALFSDHLKEESILDPCSACIVMSAGMSAGILNQTMSSRCQECIHYLKEINTQKGASARTSSLPSWTPDLSSPPPVFAQ